MQAFIPYQSATGDWIIFDGTNKIRFETEGVAQMELKKLALAQALVRNAQAIAPIMDTAPDVVQEYFDSGITFTDQDVELMGLTAVQVVSVITMLENLNKFFAGTTPGNAQYRVTVNSVRRARTE